MMEGCSSSSKKRAAPYDCRFTDTVLAWSLEDIFNENLYKVEKIPESFQSVEQYFGSYVYPLLEETRAQLCSGMEAISSAPFAEVVAFEESKPYGVQLYDVKVDYWKNRFSNTGKDPYKTLPGDILLLANAKPETISDLQGAQMTWTFVSVAKITDDENEIDTTSTYFKVKALKDIQFNDENKSLFVVFLINATTNKRIWNSLHKPRNVKIIKELLYTDSMFEEKCELCSKQSVSMWDEKFGLNLSSSLNDSQSEAVLACLHSMHCNHKPSVQLIWGPPGTGKTKTVSLLLLTLLRMRCRALVCAPTNVAITEVASRVLKLVKESFKMDSGREFPFNPLGEILLFGNEDRLKVVEEIREIYMDHRIKKLAKCCGLLTGWSHCFSSMIELLEGCLSQYQIFLENELIKSRENSNECGINGECRNETEDNHQECKSFLEFVRERFKCIANPLRNCIFIFGNHIPKTYLSENNFQNMIALTGSLDIFETLLFEENLVSEELKEIFSHPVNVDVSLSVHKKCLLLLHRTRSECHTILRILWDSFKQLELPTAMNKESLKDFCFQRASLIFCTASSSFKLRSVAMEPLNVLVIDEAAQLKESESTIPLQLEGLMHAILIGDGCQLPATVKSNVSDEAGFGRSLFERLSLLGHSKHLLNMQYRMHPSISFFPNSYFYNNQILDSSNVKRRSYKKEYLLGPMFGPYTFINIFGSRDEFIDSSYRNMVEVCAVMKILQKLYKAWSGSKEGLSIGIVSPYSAQVVAIQEKLGCKYEDSDGFAVKVKSIDGFQGGEEDIIIISTVRSNSGGSIGFTSKPQRINVALTRARHCLWILGNERTLTRSESVWEIIIRDAKERKCFFNADEDKDLAKAILDAKKELDELDELLNAESILFRNQRWKVIFSDNFLKSFKKLTSDRTKKSVINHLLKISSGWRPNKKKIDTVCERSLHIIKQFKVEGHYIVCTIDIVKDLQYIQVLKVWDILPLEDVQKLVKRLDDIFVRYTDDYINRCKEKCIEGKLEVPKTWAPSSDIVRLKNFVDSESGNDLSGAASDRSYVENSKVTDSLLLMKFYTLSSGVVNHLLSDRDGREIDLPFEVTDEQLEMILFPRSTFIVGRSGTGKTTVLTMKLFQKEKLHHEAMERFYGVDSHINLQTKEKNEDEGSGQMTRAILRQLFVTVSPKLCFAVKQHVSHLKSFVIGEKVSAKESLIDVDFIDDVAQFKDIPNSFLNLPQKAYPLVITFHKLLMMLDGTLGNSYFDRFPNIRKHSDGQIPNSQSVSLETFIRTKEVSYDRFSLLYWPHFNEQLIKKLDSSRVFSEIISHIKGGLRSMELGAGKLSREDYVQLSEGRVSTLTRQKREMIYDIFQNYERMKMENGEFDLADFVIDLHHRLEKESYKVDEIHYVYIDEVQDLTMSQIALFKYICRNVEEGFVFSGDTAQTIARGIDFRFQDIRSLFYKKFVSESRSKEHDGREEKGQVSEIFSLSQNFRTHAGVLDLAQSIIDLLYRFFRHSVDILKPEISLIYGEPPILLESRNNENAIIKIFGNSGHVSGSVVGFGAEQVILVRDDSIRNEISNYVGKQALVLTIVESKGLEFQDVLLYNFFCSTSLKNQWRVIYEYMKEQNLLDSSSPKPTSFNEAKHSVLCTELKQLYVAITRTRQRLWIWEDTEEPAKPMFDYWKKKFLVQVRELDDSLAHAMQAASSPEEWKSQGMKLFYEQCYDMATMCFERAKDTYWEERSKATGLKADADRIRSLKPEEANIKLRQAATIFEAIGKADSAAICFYDLGEYERAGKIYMEKCGEPELEKAGECFCLAGHYELAAEAYAKGNFFSECLSVCSQGKLFEVGLEYIHYWKQHAKTDDGLARRSKDINKIEQEFLERCALHFHELKDNTSMMRFVKEFNSMDLKCGLLKSLNCFDELLSLEEESGNFTDAANIAKLMGDFLRVADLLQKAGNFKESSTFLLNHVFSKSLWSSGSKGWPLKHFSQKEELLEKAKSLAKYESNQFYELVCTEADILSNDQGKLFMLGQQLDASRRHQSIRGEILSARKILDFHLQSNTSKYGWEDEMILDLRTYSEETVCKGQVSVETLVYFWNYWKDGIMNIFEYLEHLQTQDVNNYKSYGDFCLNYLSVLKEYTNVGANFLLLNSDADWARELDKRYAQRTGKLISVNVRQLVAAARSYWNSELLSVGMKVLNNLDSLFKCSSKNSSSLFCQVKNLIYIYEVSKFLLNSKFVNHRYHTKALQNFVEQSTEQFFDFIFPLDWRKSLRRNLISLRGTEICHNMMEEVICKFTDLRDKLSYGQIGRMVVMILGSSKPNNDLLERVAKAFDGNKPWQEFVEQLSENIGPGSQQILGPHDKISLIQKFHGALKDTYEVNWRKCEYISPGCFLYLIERLLILLSGIQGYILTTQSSLVDWLIYQEDVDLTSRTMFSKEYLVVVLQFVVGIVLEFLDKEKDTIDWIRRSYTNINAKQCHSLVVLRLVVTLCLLHLNFGNYAKLLFDVLARRSISSQLPREFCDTLYRRWKRNSLNVNVIAEAFKKIGNPLVVVSVGEPHTMFRCPDAIFIDVEVRKCKEDMLRIMFPKFEASQAHFGAAKASSTPKKVLSSDCHGQGKSSILPSSSSASFPRWDSGPQNINEDELLMNLGHFWKKLEVLDSEDQKSIVSKAPTIKVDVEKFIRLLTTASNGCSQKNPIEGEQENRLLEAASMLEELKQLYAALDASVLKVENISTIGELCKRLQSKRPTMEPLLNRILLQQSPNLEGKAIETGSASGGLCDEADINSEANESSSPDKGKKAMPAIIDSGSQGNRPETENKGMGKGKPKKNKKGKGGRKHR